MLFRSVWCRDGVRRRFHIIRENQRASLELDRDHFAADVPVRFDASLSALSFAVETTQPAAHTTSLSLTGFPPGSYRVKIDRQPPQEFLQQGAVTHLTLKLNQPRHTVTITARNRTGKTP